MYQFLYQIFSTPFGYVMRLIYQFVGSYGVSIFLFALLVKVLMLPLSFKTKRSMMEVQRIQPKVQQIQKTYARDQRRMQEELQNLYDQEGVSPIAGCGTQLIILPIMLGLYGVILYPLQYFMQLTSAQITQIAERLNYTMSGVYSQIGLAGQVYQHFDQVADISDKLLRVSFNFGPFDLTASPQFKVINALWFLPVISALTSFGLSWLTQRMQAQNTPNPNPQMQQSNKMMLFMMPLMSLWFGYMLPGGLTIYWISNNILSAVQEFCLNKWVQKKLRDGKEN